MTAVDCCSIAKDRSTRWSGGDWGIDWCSVVCIAVVLWPLSPQTLLSVGSLVIDCWRNVSLWPQGNCLSMWPWGCCPVISIGVNCVYIRSSAGCLGMSPRNGCVCMRPCSRCLAMYLWGSWLCIYMAGNCVGICHSGRGLRSRYNCMGTCVVYAKSRWCGMKCG